MRVKQLIFFSILIIAFLIINGMIHSILTLNQKNELLVNTKQALEKEKQTNVQLKKQLTKIDKPQFIENEARNKLFLAKPGEEIIVLSESQAKANAQTKKKPAQAPPPWKQWWELFF